MTSMEEAFSKDPLWRRVNDNMHHTGLCTATLQLCKRIQTLSKHRINHIYSLSDGKQMLHMESSRVQYDTNDCFQDNIYYCSHYITVNIMKWYSYVCVMFLGRLGLKKRSWSRLKYVAYVAKNVDETT